MSIISIDVARAAELLKQGAILVDIREPNEHAREKIAASQSLPLSQLQGQMLNSNCQPIIFYCLSGNRTRVNAERLRGLAGTKIHLLEGGISAWKLAGHPTLKNLKHPIEMMRQVQIAAGGLVLCGAVLGYFYNPAFYAVSAAVGAGLMFSGISGTCTMAQVLKLMPWNKV